VLSDLRDLLDQQAGVLSRRQVIAAGLGDNDLRRLLRRGELVPLHPGVYVNHNGDPHWLQRAWAGVLAVWPAALCHESALRSVDGPGRRPSGMTRDETLHVAVDRDRSVRAPDGVTLHRIANFESKALVNASPPRLRIEEALIDVAAGSVDDFNAIAVLANGVQSRRTTPERILMALQRRSRVARRAFLMGVLQDICAGSNSALEHAFLQRVERPHGLPRPDRQHRPDTHNVYRDLDYVDFGLVIELDGRLFHDHARGRDADLHRDLLAKAHDGRDTVRLGWGQAVHRPCATAAAIGVLLGQRGWKGSIRRCATCADR
jgi:Transcriptional regulator, AbiEi antitoxin